MPPLPFPIRQARRQLGYLRGLLDLSRHGNRVIRRTDFARCKRPVLLLYGFMATRRVFEVFESRLRRDGYCVWSINLGGLFDAFNTRGIDELAEKVRDKVERLYARHPELGPLAIIGHSKGGLIGRYYLKRLGGDRRCCALITLGTPHHGSPTAYLGVLGMGLVSRSVWQMTPMSPFIRRLKLGTFPPTVRFVSIYSKEDRFSPFPSCIIETRGLPNLFNVEVPGVRHHEMLLKRSVYDVVRRELELAYQAADGRAAVPADEAG